MNIFNRYWVIICCLLCVVNEAAAQDAAPLRKQVVPIKAEVWNRPSLQGTFANEMRYMLRLNNKYTLNKWYHEVKHLQDQTGEYFDFGGRTEHFIRPVTHHVLTLGLCLKWHVYDPAMAQMPERQAVNVTVKLIRSVAYRHKANMGEGGWGSQWQSALWAAQLASAAWVMWDELSASDHVNGLPDDGARSRPVYGLQSALLPRFEWEYPDKGRHEGGRECMEFERLDDCNGHDARAPPL